MREVRHQRQSQIPEGQTVEAGGRFLGQQVALRTEHLLQGVEELRRQGLQLELVLLRRLAQQSRDGVAGPLDEVLGDLAGRDGGRVVAFALLFDGLQVQRGEAQVVCSGLCGGVQLRREDPLVGPLEDGAVGGGGVVVVVLTGDVEREVDEGLAAGFDE